MPSARPRGRIVTLWISCAREVGDQCVAGLVVGDHALLLVGDQLALLEARDHPLERGGEVGLVSSSRAVAAGARSPPRCRCSRGRRRSDPRSGGRSRPAPRRSASGLLRVCTSRIASRPVRSGGAISTWRSNRPGRSSAGSRCSSRFEAATTTSRSRSSNPSSSTSSWFSVWSCSRLLPPPSRLEPTASSSSMKMIAGWFSRAVEKSLRMRAAPSPAPHLDELRRALEVEVRSRLARDGLGHERLAGPRRAVHQHALGHPRAQLLEPVGLAQELDDLLELGARLLEAGHVVPAHRGCRPADRWCAAWSSGTRAPCATRSTRCAPVR